MIRNSKGIRKSLKGGSLCFSPFLFAWKPKEKKGKGGSALKGGREEEEWGWESKTPTCKSWPWSRNSDLKRRDRGKGLRAQTARIKKGGANRGREQKDEGEE